MNSLRDLFNLRRRETGAVFLCTLRHGVQVNFRKLLNEMSVEIIEFRPGTAIMRIREIKAKGSGVPPIQELRGACGSQSGWKTARYCIARVVRNMAGCREWIQWGNAIHD